MAAIRMLCMSDGIKGLEGMQKSKHTHTHRHSNKLTKGSWQQPGSKPSTS